MNSHEVKPEISDETIRQLSDTAFIEGLKAAAEEAGRTCERLHEAAKIDPEVLNNVYYGETP